jgi:hypothetical protein
MANPIQTALRYLKRTVMLPWRFHQHAQAEAEHREQMQSVLATLAGQQIALSDLVNTQTHVLASHLAKLVWEEFPRMVCDHYREATEQMAAGIRDRQAESAAEIHDRLAEMVAEYRLRLAEIAAEQRLMTDHHASCYDRLVEQLRALADELAAQRTGGRRAA